MLSNSINDEINSIAQQLIKNYFPEKIILFGSAARGKFNENSDLDFLIIKSDVPFLGRNRYYQIAKLVQYKTPSDFLICTPHEISERLKLRDPFITQIYQEGKVLYG